MGVAFGGMWEGYSPQTSGFNTTCAQGHFRCVAGCDRKELHLDDVSVLDVWTGIAMCLGCRERRRQESLRAAIGYPD